MKKCIFSVITILLYFGACAQDADRKEILKVLQDQTFFWNKGDIDNFMKGYWKSDSLTFVGKTVTYGYQNTLTHYKETYNNAEKMGKLFYELLKVKKLSGEYYFVLGKWLLKRKAGDIGGYYTLLFKKINGRWKIISDHTS